MHGLFDKIICHPGFLFVGPDPPHKPVKDIGYDQGEIPCFLEIQDLVFFKHPCQGVAVPCGERSDL